MRTRALPGRGRTAAARLALVLAGWLGLLSGAGAGAVEATDPAAGVEASESRREAVADSGAMRARLDGILARPEYNRWRLRGTLDGGGAAFEWPKWLRDTLQSMVDWIERKWREFFGRSTPPEHDSGGGGDFTVAQGAAYLLMAALLAVLAVITLRHWRRRPAVKVDGEGMRLRLREALERGEALALGEEEWLESARGFFAAGDTRAAYRALYLSLLARLHRRGWIRFKRSRTNWAYVRSFKGPAASRDEFSGLTETFDLAWYGGQTVVLADFPALEARAVRLIRAGDGDAASGVFAEGGSARG